MSIYQAIAIVSAALAVLAGGWDAHRLRTTQRYSAVGLAISALGPILSLVLYLVVTQVALKLVVSLVLFALGGFVGVYVAQRRSSLMKTSEAGQIRVVGASWLPLPAALSVAGLQIAGSVNLLAAMVLCLAALEMAVAFGIGAAVTLMYRRSALDRVAGQLAGPTPPAGSTPPAGPWQPGPTPPAGG